MADQRRGPRRRARQRATYLGGTFDQVGPNTGFGVGLDPATGALALGGAKVNGHVHAAVPNGRGGWFIAGDFTRVGPVSRHRP
ncbi:MAG: hypothetical protein ACRDYF_04000 [Acidimicrobiia bacterium]